MNTRQKQRRHYPNAAYHKLARLIHEHIEMGLYSSQERLPSITELEALYNAKRSVVRNALRVLKEDRLIVSRDGDGHYIVTGPVQGDDEEENRLNRTRHAVLVSGASSLQIAKRTGVSRWSITRMLHGRIPLTPLWSVQIIRAAQKHGEVMPRQPDQD
jgi:DNA-binding GntR family transcriptional regulator